LLKGDFLKKYIMIISRISEVPLKGNLVMLGDKASNFYSFPFNSNEVDYIKKRIEKKDTQVVINRYDQSIYIQIIDRNKTDYKVLEESRKLASKLHSLINANQTQNIAIVDVEKNDDVVLAYSEGLALTNYQFIKYFKDADEKKSVLSNIELVSLTLDLVKLEQFNIMVDAIYRTRDLINEPPNVLTAPVLADEIRKLGKEASFKVEVFEKEKIEALKMGGLLAVNQGSTEPPRFSILEWKPANATNSKPLVLIGKGIVYDSGGLSLKPTRDSMDYMKTDMSGAAAVAGAFYAVAKSKLPVWIIGLVPSTDNRIDANAYAPGDVITMMSGDTVEMLNADAEGRMILADALSFAKQYDPEVVITIATLTGAAAAAIGPYGIVAMHNETGKYFGKVVESGNQVYERIVEFPFWDEYAELIKSDIADLQNVGGKSAGAITAGKFLEYFTDYPFIHLDIAGAAFNHKADSYRGNGGTGVGVRLFFDLVKNWDK
jgi:leucyl aminopeptidase